jgi:4-hydroxy-tetrahydrodipicolinate synthase
MDYSQKLSKEFCNGVYTVLVTPFANDDTIDYPSIDRWLHHQYKNNVVGLVLLGTTSESPTLTLDEKVSIVKHVYEFNLEQHPDNRKMIVVGVGGNCTKDVIDFGNLIKDYADAFMVTVPHYNKPPQRGIYEHFRMISKSFSNVPIMMYNIPGRTGVNMEPDTIIDVIRSCPNVKALKDAGGSIEKTYVLEALLEKYGINVGTDFKLFSGDDDAINLITRVGGSGVISVASNIIPYYVCEYINDILNGKLDMAENKFNKCDKLIKCLFSETNPIPIKEIMNYAKIYDTNHMRLPLVNMSYNNAKTLHELYDSFVGNTL